MVLAAEPLVQGLVVCRKCGYAMSCTSTRTSTRQIHYYRCLGPDAWRRLNGPVCDNKPVLQDLLDVVVWNEVLRLLEDPGLIQQELDRRLPAASAADPTRKRQAGLEQEAARVNKAMDRLVTAYQEDLLSVDELRQRMPALKQRDQTIRAELQAIADQARARGDYVNWPRRCPRSSRVSAVPRTRWTSRSASRSCACSSARCWWATTRSSSGIASPHRQARPGRRRRLKSGPNQVPGAKVTFCVRGVLSPVLANLYMNRFLKYWRRNGHRDQLQAHVVAYADDLVILTRGHAAEAMARLQTAMPRLGLKVNAAKTTTVDARTQQFDFLGYSFGTHRTRRNGAWYLGASPSKTSVQRLKTHVRALLVPSNTGTWFETRDRLNRMLRGWAGYFCYGTVTPAYRAVDAHVDERARHFLRRRHKVATRATRQFSTPRLFGDLGVTSLQGR